MGTMDLLDFEIAREGWTVVELEDGTIIRMRPVLLFLRRGLPRRRKPGVRADMRFNIQFGVWGRKKGKPSRGPLPAELIKKNIVKSNLTFRFLHRGDSLYRTRDGDVRLVITPTKFDRSRLFDKDGEPVYFVGHELSAALATEIRSPKK